MTISSRTDQAADNKRRVEHALKLNTDRHVAADQDLVRRKLAIAKQQQANCRSCKNFKTLKYTTYCNLGKGKPIMWYCICHLWEKKAQGK